MTEIWGAHGTRRRGKQGEGGICSYTGSIPPLEHITPDDVDALEEENIVKLVVEGAVDPNVAVLIRGLVKTYCGTTNVGCCKCKSTSPYHAVKIKSLGVKMVLSGEGSEEVFGGYLAP